jgi:D-xylose transport system permease protein
MSDAQAATTEPESQDQPAPEPSGSTWDGYRRRGGALFRASEVDARLLGLLIALAIAWIFFDIASAIVGQGGDSIFGGNFLIPRNLWNLSVQTVSIAVMATGMVLVIVSRNIDLSVGSLLGFLAMVMGLTQTEWLPQVLGFDSPWIWIITLAVGLGLGALIGAGQGFLIAYAGIPAFIVTLGGLFIWRGMAFALAQGVTVAPLDVTFKLIGGGTEGSLGRLGVDLGIGSETLSWLLGVGIVILLIGFVVYARHRRRTFGFPTRPAWAEITIIGVGSVLVLGSMWVANSYAWPTRVAQRYAESIGLEIPEGGLVFANGVAYPVLILLGVGAAMAFLTRRRSFGRYVYAIGGNPEAAELSGINVRRTIMLTFVLMGVLVAIAAAIVSGRLDAAVNSLGVLNELYVIAAAVVGGTVLAGGIGTIPGAILGALFIQTLQSGMVLIGMDTQQQNVVIGVVLVAAVGLDTWLRKRTET